MERIRNLDRYQKAILLVLLSMAVVFAALYTAAASREGYCYHDTILVPAKQGDATIYNGRLGGAVSSFTVTENTVTFRRGETVYGPYTLRYDPTAIPDGHEFAEYMTGLEILDGEEIFFRGALFSGSDSGVFYHENGEVTHGISISAVMGDGTVVGMDGTPVDPYAPSLWTIVKLIEGPELTAKGYWPAFLMGVVFSMIATVSILFADDLFRFRMSFRVQDADKVEPSEWEIASRYIGWTVIPVMILFLYFAGLRADKLG